MLKDLQDALDHAAEQLAHDLTADRWAGRVVYFLEALGNAAAANREEQEYEDMLARVRDDIARRLSIGVW